MKHFQAGPDAEDLAELEQLLGRLRTRLAGRSSGVAIDAEQWWALRRRRDAVFDGLGLFSEPAWDILLTLRIARDRGRRETVGSVSIAAACPLTTASRHVAELVRAGLVAREEDVTDARRFHLQLTEQGDALMNAALSPMRSSDAAPFAI